MSNRIKGLVLTGFLGILVIMLFYGTIVKDPNNYYFSHGGDGFKAYYGAIYHLKHDTSIMRMNGMNYPHGEMVFFTGCQPLVVNTVKLFSNYIYDINDNIVGIMNLLMLFSILIAAIFIFLIFYEFDVNWIYASFVSIGICMLSPQIARFGGHFSLSYLFWIPLMVYLIIRFDKKPGIFMSIIIAVVTFSASAMHLYFFGFYGFIIGLYWFAQIFRKNSKITFIKGALNFFIQYIFPFILLQLIIALNDPITDRPSFPFGFVAYRAHPVAIFFPSGKPYGFIRDFLTVFEHISWESIAFVGMTALIGTFTGLILFIKKLAKKKIFKISNYYVLNILFWFSVVALFFSFGIPFILGMEWLVDYVGPFRQLRALARFSWFFYYMINIVVFYQIYKCYHEKSKKVIWKYIPVLAISVLLFEGYWNIGQKNERIQNRRPALADVSNNTSENAWVNVINPSEFQAILPIPFFHVGSENIWIKSQNGTQELAMIASIKTGLPMLGVQLSRTSLQQSFSNIALVSEPTEELELINQLPNNKPFLLLFNRNNYPGENQKRLIQLSKLIFQNEKIELRKLEIEKLKSLYSTARNRIIKESINKGLISKGNLLLTDSTSYVYRNGFNALESDVTFEGDGALSYSSEKWKLIAKDSLLGFDVGEQFKVSFWVHNYMEDGFLRGNIEFVQKNILNNKVTKYYYTDVQRHVVAFYEDWALVEFPFSIKSLNETYEISVRNEIVKNTEFVLDEIIVRQDKVDIFMREKGIVYKNGRKVLL